MQIDDLILADDFCSYYKVEHAFINTLHQNGLLEITSIETVNYIPINELQKLEQIIRLHYELNINLEGIEAIAHLLERVKDMQSEVVGLKNRLKFYESFE